MRPGCPRQSEASLETDFIYKSEKRNNKKMLKKKPHSPPLHPIYPITLPAPKIFWTEQSPDWVPLGIPLPLRTPNRHPNPRPTSFALARLK